MSKLKDEFRVTALTPLFKQDGEQSDKAQPQSLGVHTSTSGSVIFKAVDYPFYVRELRGVVDIGWTAQRDNATKFPADEWNNEQAEEVISQIGECRVERIRWPVRAQLGKVFGGRTRGYLCDGCGKPFHWDGESSWYGSYRDLEEQVYDRIWFACSEECRQKKPADFPQKKNKSRIGK